MDTENDPVNHFPAERPFGSATPPAALYRYSPDRKGLHPQNHLKAFRGHLHADGYAGFNKLYERQPSGSDPLIEVACWAHVRRKFFDIHKAGASPLAEEAINRIGTLYEVERQVRGEPPDVRAERRQQETRPLLNNLKAWLNTTLTKTPKRSELAKAIRYALTRWQALTRIADHPINKIDQLLPWNIKTA